MQGRDTTVRFTLTGAGMTLTTAPVPVQQFDVVRELATLIIAMTRAGRLPPDAHVLMAATGPLPQEERHFNIPLLVDGSVQHGCHGAAFAVFTQRPDGAWVFHGISRSEIRLRFPCAVPVPIPPPWNPWHSRLQ